MTLSAERLAKLAELINGKQTKLDSTVVQSTIPVEPEPVAIVEAILAREPEEPAPTAIVEPTPIVEAAPKTNGAELAEVEAAKVTRRAIKQRQLETPSGAVRGCMANALLALRTSFQWNGAKGNILRWNSFSGKIELRGRSPWGKPEGEAWNDSDDVLCLEWLECEGIFLNSSARASEAVRAVAAENSFHPIREYFSGLRWDAKPRIENLFPVYAGCEDNLLNCAVGRVFMVGAVSRIMQPGSKFEVVPILIGPQGVGKSQFCRALCPDAQYFCDHLSILGSKDSRMELRGKLVIEFSELDNLRGAPLERVKGFLTTHVDHYRGVYGRTEADVPRQCCFVGTTNNSTPLADASGARRFIPIRCGKMNVEQLKADRNQLWAEAYSRYQRGAKWYLDSKELVAAAEEQQRLAYCPGPWDDLIEAFLERPQPIPGNHQEFLSSRGRVLLSDILSQAIGKRSEDWKQTDQNSVSRCLIHNGYERKQLRSGNRRLWFYVKDGID